MQAVLVKPGKTVNWVADADRSSGDVIQLPDGRAGVLMGDVVSGATIGVHVSGVFKVAKTTSMVMLRTSKLFWDDSASKCHLLHVQDRDFFLGKAVDDAASADTVAYVDLNVQPVFTVGLEHGFATVRVQTAGFVSGCGAGREGCNLEFSATAEAQKADALSFRGVSPAGLTGGVGHALICVNSGGDNAALDINIGLANGTHASDADSITESLFIHIDGNSTNINAESDDGTTEVAATDTTKDYTAGTPFLAQWDFSDLSDIQLYIDGVNVLPASVFKLNAAAGPLKFLAHMEKSSDDTPANVSVLYGGVAIAEGSVAI